MTWQLFPEQHALTVKITFHSFVGSGSFCKKGRTSDRVPLPVWTTTAGDSPPCQQRTLSCSALYISQYSPILHQMKSLALAWEQISSSNGWLRQSRFIWLCRPVSLLEQGTDWNSHLSPVSSAKTLEVLEGSNTVATLDHVMLFFSFAFLYICCKGFLEGCPSEGSITNNKWHSAGTSDQKPNPSSPRRLVMYLW